MYIHLYIYIHLCIYLYVNFDSDLATLKNTFHLPQIDQVQRNWTGQPELMMLLLDAVRRCVPTKSYFIEAILLFSYVVIDFLGGKC